MQRNITHSPGPWFALCNRPRSADCAALVSTKIGADTPSRMRMAIDVTHSGANYPEDCANAMLVAAAPEGLHAAQLAVACFDKQGSVDTMAIEALRMFITKATARALYW